MSHAVSQRRLFSAPKQGVLVDGDNYAVAFFAPSYKQRDGLFMAVPMIGASLIREFISAGWEDLEPEFIRSSKFEWRPQLLGVQSLALMASEKAGLGDDQSAETVLRIPPVSRPISGKVICTEVRFTCVEPQPTQGAMNCHVYVERDCGWPLRQEPSSSSHPPQDITCNAYIRLGSTETEVTSRGPLDQRWDTEKDRVVDATQVAVAVLDTQRLSLEGGVRLHSSYEAIAVDVLRLVREKGDLLQRLFPRAKHRVFEADIFLVIWLAEDAVLVYRARSKQAWLHYDRRRPAPVRDTEKGTMIGYGTILAGCLAGALAVLQGNDDAEQVRALVEEGVRLGIACCEAYLRKGFCQHEKAEKAGDHKEVCDRYLKDFQAWLNAVKVNGERAKCAGELAEAACRLVKLAKHLGIPNDKGSSPPFEEFGELVKKVGSLASVVWPGEPLRDIRGSVESLKVIGKDARAETFLEKASALKRKLEDALKNEEACHVKTIELCLEDVFSLRKPWTILERTMFAETKVVPDERVYSAKAKEVLTTPDGLGTLPVVTFGRQQLVERSEIEDYLSLYQAFLQYPDESGDRPLSVAVFGPPGSGKTHGVKEVVGQASRSTRWFGKTEPLTFNVSQFLGQEEFAAALHAVRDQCLQSAIPLVFFDEFDCSYQGQDFGWLKYFLAPMEDGMFWEKSHPYRVGKCVFVFAGGVNRTFAEMNGRLRNPNFCAAKGPDFISRLRGSLNLRGINRPDADADDGRHMIRRAVILHSLLGKKHKDCDERLPDALLSEALAEAFIHIDNFKHGVRSLRAILDMAAFHPGRTLCLSDLPSSDQLDMHVDARKFGDLISSYGKLFQHSS